MTAIYPSLNIIKEAHERIKPFIHRTPVLKSSLINDLLNVEFYFKCENLQKVGAFKYRGATNAVQLLSDIEASKGVTTHSSGNHAAALSLAARKRDIPAYIVMPENAPSIKKAAVQSYGAQITYCEPTLEAREKTLDLVQQKTGATFIHPYNNFNVISGQGTAAVELLEDYPQLDAVIAPVGGGGLLSGTAIATKSINHNIKVYGAEPLNADDAYRSFKQGIIIPSENPNTIADGLLTSLGTITFQAIRDNVDDIFRTKEETIILAMRLIWERMKIIVEPSAAVPLAIVIENKDFFKNKKIGIIFSGGNVDLNQLPFH
ncbi:MAG: serine dehydratase [Bacteroidetes bacterium GWF2_33_16]|nr:MAG: serine dehydratase [Bacteroidetes bacterium GWE2_32_14]OFY03663.1 MAG: serine dehydratase [Bacteroidetes bacterium GWF2_33_16]